MLIDAMPLITPPPPPVDEEEDVPEGNGDRTFVAILVAHKLAGDNVVLRKLAMLRPRKVSDDTASTAKKSEGLGQDPRYHHVRGHQMCDIDAAHRARRG